MAIPVKSAPGTISAPNIKSVKVKLIGTAPYMQARFSQKAMNAMMETMSGTKKGGTKRVREARDYEEDYRGAMHVSAEGWVGIPASSLRAGIISACRLVGFTMTRAKLSVFVPAEGLARVGMAIII